MLEKDKEGSEVKKLGLYLGDESSLSLPGVRHASRAGKLDRANCVRPTNEYFGGNKWKIIHSYGCFEWLLL